ncbi:hypothetical protein LEN26_003883 [Aphanomyces euteiches]|nr:hypothetical protein LEN26_003883 [Aphanomyces euteiches]
MGKSFFTFEDLTICPSPSSAFVDSVGTLTMPRNYASAGFLWVTIIFTALVNIYAMVCILAAPKSVRPFADLGEDWSLVDLSAKLFAAEYFERDLWSSMFGPRHSTTNGFAICVTLTGPSIVAIVTS